MAKKNEYSFFIPKLSDTALDERRAHILAAAEVCFARNGFHNTTIADVRHEAGVSTGAIYTYFPNKEAILRTIIERARDERKSQLETATRDGASMDPGVVLLEWASAIFSARGQHAARVDVNLWAEALHNARVQRLAEGALSEATAAVSAVVSSRLPSSGAAEELDPGSVASVLIALFLGLEVQTAVGMRLGRTEVIRVLVALFEDYLPGSVEPRPPAVERTHRRGRKKR